MFGALLGDRPIDWGLLIYDVVTRMVGLVSKGKPTMVCPFMFYLYKERQVLRSAELATYTVAMEMVKYDCTLDPEPNPERGPTPSHSGSDQLRPTSTLEKSRKKKMPTKRRGESSAQRQDLNPNEPSTFKMERNAQAFDNAITWIETARENFDDLGQIVKDVVEVLEIMDLRDFDRALSTIPKPKELAERDHRIQGHQKDKAILNARIAQKEADWAQANQKTSEALSLLTQFQSYIGQPDDIVTKARIFDETVAKGLLVTGSKVINIVVNYSSKMETLLVGMQKLMVDLQPAALPTGSIDLTDFLELPAAEILQGLSTPTKGPRVQTASPVPPADPDFDTWTRPTKESPLPDQALPNPSLPFEPGPSDPPPPPSAPPKVQPLAPPSSLPRSEPPTHRPVPPTLVRTPPSLQTRAGPTQRNLPFSQGRGRGDPPRFSHLLWITTGTGDVPASSKPTPARKDPPPTEILESELDLEESTDGEAGSGSESVLESEPEPVPTQKKTPKTQSGRQPSKAKAAARTRSPAGKGTPSKKARK